MAGRLELGPAQGQVARWREAAWALEDRARLALGGGGNQAELNRSLKGIEREWLLAEGIPGRPWFKHALYAPKYTYAAMELPGVREAVDQGDWERARTALGALTERIRAVADAISRAGLEPATK